MANSRQPLTRLRQAIARDRSRQLEPWKHGILEAGHCSDPAAAEGEDVEADTVAHTVRRSQVGSERRLTVSSRAHKIVPPASREEVRTKADHEVSTFVFERH